MDKRRLLSPTGTRLEPLEKSVYLTLKPHRSHLQGKKLIVAVSGGIDSVILLHVLKALETRFKFKLTVGHVNHSVRGKHSDDDAKFVTELCKKLKIPIAKKKLKGIKPNASENLLREKRYEFLMALKKKIGSEYVVTAHHQDDLLETRLMRLLQGTGVKGLRAMIVLNKEGVLRPLLHSSRHDIEAYAREKKLTWRNDATNSDTTKFRNWIRRNWVGVLRREHPEYLPTLFNSLERIVLSVMGPEVPVEAVSLDRLPLLNKGLHAIDDEVVYNFLRQHGRSRITSSHVSEFKKQLLQKRKQYNFRLAGRDWAVKDHSVEPV